MKPARHVAIIGAGMAGVAVLIHLARQKCRSIGKITLIDVNQYGHGLAFGDPDPDLLCNTSTDIGSLIVHDPDDFVRWLAAFGRCDHRDAFVPRDLAARYASERYDRARHSLQTRGIAVYQIHETARQVTGTPGHYVVHTGTDTLTATDVVICAGAITPVIPDLLAAHLCAESITVGPYPVETLIAKTAPTSRVLVIGTRLSAVDAALVLAREGRHVTLTSRSGLLPAVRTRYGHPIMHLPTRARIAALDPNDSHMITGVLRIGVEHLRAHTAVPLRHQLSRTPDGIARLREETHLAASGQTYWQEVPFDIATALNEATWVSRLTPERRAQLDCHFHEYVVRYSPSMPLVNARKLIDYHEQGCFDIAPSFPTNLMPTPQGWRVDIAARRQTFDHIVSAAGYTAPYLSIASRPNEPANLKLLTSPSENANSYSIDRCLRLRRHARTCGERIWIVGMTARKHVFAPNFLPTVVKMAARTAACITTDPARLDQPDHIHDWTDVEAAPAENCEWDYSREGCK